MKLVFLVEEQSMCVFLQGLLPRILSEEISFQIIPHNGKNDLKKSIPRKLKAWNEPNVRFVIIQDQDSSDCRKLKQELKELCQTCGKEALIRIACIELEAWYFGDLKALSTAYGKDLERLGEKEKYRIPDEIGNPKQELRKLIPEHQQISGARKIAPYIDIKRNRSKSFQVFISGVAGLINS